MSQFFTYDHHFGCIQPLLSSDQPSFPHLVSKLSRDIHNRIIKLNQPIWPHILNQSQPLGEVDDSAFIDAFCLQPQWINYKLKPFRLFLIQWSSPSSAMLPISTSKWSLFGNCLFRRKAGLYGIVYSTVNSIANYFFQDLITGWPLHNVNSVLLILKTRNTSSCAVLRNGEYGKMLSISLVHTSLSLKTMYAQSCSLFSRFLSLTILISGLSAAVCFPLSGVPTGDLLLTTSLLLINSWSLVLCRSLPPSKGVDLTLTSMFNRVHSVSFGSHRSRTCDSHYIL
jgi:hypothetical protein